VRGDDTAAARAQIDTILERFEQTRHTAPPRMWQWLLTGSVVDACVAIGDRERAAEVLNAVIKAYPDTEAGLEARAGLIYLAIRSGDKASALRLIDDLITRYKVVPDGVDPVAWARQLSGALADACTRIEAWDRAEECYTTVLKVFPDGDIARESLFGLARLYDVGFEGRRLNEQAAILLRIAEQYAQAPDGRRALLEAARCFEWRLKDKAAAETLYKRLTAEYAGTTEAFQATGRLIAMPLHAGNLATAEQMLRAFDETLAEHTDRAQAAQADLIVTRELYRCLWNYPSRTELRERMLGRFSSLAEEYLGTPAAVEALFDLASHYATPEYFDAEKATAYALRFLDEGRGTNAERYAGLVGRIMQDHQLLLQELAAELPERARDLMKRFQPPATRERREFLLGVESSYGSAFVDRMLAKVTAFAREHGDQDLLKEAIVLWAEVSVCRDRPDKALGCLASLAASDLALSPEQQRRVQECRACCYILRQEHVHAVPVLEKLAHSAADAESSAEGNYRPKAHYDYWRAVAAFHLGQYAASKEQFEALASLGAGDRHAERATSYVRHIEHLLRPTPRAEVVHD